MKVKTAKELLILAEKNKAVKIKHWKKHSPAKWIVNMPFGIVAKCISLGWVEKVAKKSKNKS